MVYTARCDPLSDCHDYPRSVNIDSPYVGDPIGRPAHHLCNRLIGEPVEDRACSKGAPYAMQVLLADLSRLLVHMHNVCGISDILTPDRASSRICSALEFLLNPLTSDSGELLPS